MLATENKAKGLESFAVDQKEIGARIRQLREAKDMTQADLSKLIDMSRSAIAQWETGKACPSLSDLNRIAFFLGSTAQFIAFGVAASHQDTYRIPVMDYTTPKGAPVGEMSIDMDFFRSLRRPAKTMLRAFTLPRGDMVEGLERGSVIIIDEADSQVIGAGEAYLIHHKVPVVAYVNAVPNKEDSYAVRIGGQFFQIDGDLPVIGRVVASMRANV